MYQRQWQPAVIGKTERGAFAALATSSAPTEGWTNIRHDLAVLTREVTGAVRRWCVYRDIAAELRSKNEEELQAFRLDRDEIELTAYALAERIEGNR
jgi:hypothetical protein